ncbi:hypothetical protein ACLKMY_13150 [Paraburkholderia mimosarum]|uniref:hypothetical protein n=1 Tax=Paraburkholderia mimosarum TaxID=312026 RepID=UPI0039C222BE
MNIALQRNLAAADPVSDTAARHSAAAGGPHRNQRRLLKKIAEALHLKMTWEVDTVSDTGMSGCLTEPAGGWSAITDARLGDGGLCVGCRVVCCRSRTSVGEWLSRCQ